MSAPRIELGKPDYTSLEPGPPPAERPYVLINMVQSVDGRVTIEGTERGLGSDTDQRLMRELRVNADVVLNGASTLRASGSTSRVGNGALEELRVSRGKSRNPIAAVVSRSGDMPLDGAFYTGEDFEAVVYLSEAAPADRREAIAATGRTVVTVPRDEEVPAMLRHMRRELGAKVVLTEGGPTLNGEIIDGGFADELFITLGALLVGGADPLTVVEQTRGRSLAAVTRLALVSAFANPETNELYLRYRLRHNDASGA